MRSGKDHLNISTARADALFASTLQRSDDPSTAQIRQAISTAIRACGTRGCAAQVAQAYGEHPETAVLRMRWARAEITRTFGGGRPEPVRAAPGAAAAGATVPGAAVNRAPVRGPHAAAGGYFAA
jgi:hypothetical protein